MMKPVAAQQALWPHLLLHGAILVVLFAVAWIGLSVFSGPGDLSTRTIAAVMIAIAVSLPVSSVILFLKLTRKSSYETKS